MVAKKEKRKGANSGRSKSLDYPNGMRRRDHITGELFAPRSIRKNTRKLLSACSEKELEKAQIKKD